MTLPFKQYTFILVALALVTYGNLVGPSPRQRLGDQLTLLEAAYLAVFFGILAWGRWIDRLTLADLGLTPHGLGSSLGWGLAAGAAMAVLPVVFFAFPLIAPQPVRYDPYAGLEMAAFFMVGVVRPLLDVALFEELAFRGLLQTLSVRALGAAKGIALTCASFVLWHAVVTYQTIHLTNLTGAAVPVPLLYAAAALPLAAAGLIFSMIRHATGNLAGCVLAHWLVNTLMRSFLFLQPLGSG